MVPWTSLLLVGASWWATVGVRLEMPLAFMDDAVAQKEECVDLLRPFVNATTYRDLFRPIMEGTYMLRARGTWKYLGFNRNGDMNLSADNTRWFRWSLKRAKRDRLSTMPDTFSFRNRRARKFLTSSHASAGIAVAGVQWYLRLDVAGKYYALEHAEGGGFLQAQSLESAIPQGHAVWDLIPSTRMGSRRKTEPKKQWSDVSGLPILPGLGSRLQWHDICDEVECAEVYSQERQRFINLGMLRENDRHVVTESKVRGICDWSMPSLRGLLVGRVILRDIFLSDLGSSCKSSDINTFRHSLREALEEECFGSCMGTMDDMLSTHACGQEPNWTSFFEEAVTKNAQCEILPFDSVESVADFLVQKRCLEFHPPSLLWTANDELPGDLASHNNGAVCSVYHSETTSSKSKKDIIQRGMCPESTTCQCPEQWARERQTTRQIRAKGSMHLFVKQGAAAVPSLLKKIAQRAILYTLRGAIAQGLLVGSLAGLTFTAIGAVIFSQKFLLMTGGSIAVKIILGKAQWRCAQTVGCWPTKPVLKKKDGRFVCRMREEVKAGGSPVWFLPPPGLHVERLEKIARCQLRVCSAEDLLAQRVGLGTTATDSSQADAKPNIYNCQPLSFKDMSTDKQQHFVEALKESGVFSEYDEEEIQKTVAAAELRESDPWSRAFLPMQ